ncbi:MAG: MBL fold metallo-hydrolase [Spirochaetia bacterium]|nr:MBL fold metallo-hydrolase [Spirochaetia bacterium]
MIMSLSVGPLGVDVYLWQCAPGRCVVVDPGAEPERILGALDREGLEPALVALTHGHLDHTAALPALLAALRGRGVEPPVAIHRADARYLGPEGEETNRRIFADIGGRGYFERFRVELPPADVLLEDGDLLPGTGFRVIHTPGHSSGSCCFHDEAEGVLVSGDTLFRRGVGRTDTFDGDQALLERSIRERLFALPRDTRVYPGHGPGTSIGAELGALD